MPITDPLILPPDVLLIPVRRLAPAVRAGIDCDDGDFALTRPAGRARSMIVDPDSAALLEFFRSPRTVAEAVVLYCAARGGEPREILEAVYPLVERIYQRQLLTHEGARESGGLQPRHAPGGEIGGWRIVRGVQTLEDTEVHEVRGPEGMRAAMKIVREPNRPWLASMFARERRILETLGGRPGPAPRDAGVVAGCDFLVVEWIEGRDVLTAAHEIRRAGGNAAREPLAALCLAVLEAYAALHTAGVLHSDIHPRNALAGADGAVTLIDFGISRLIDPPADFSEPSREGVGYFFEPEYARAALEPGKPAHPRASVAGEVYGLAGMLTLLLTGRHYLDFPLEREMFLKAIVETDPAPWASRGLIPWLSVEVVLRRALQKTPDARYGSVAEFADAFRAAVQSPARADERAAPQVASIGGDPAPRGGLNLASRAPSAAADGESGISNGVLDTAAALRDMATPSRVPSKRAATPSEFLEALHAAAPFRDLLPLELLAGHAPLPAPSCSLTYGAAGVAYALLRAAALTGDAALLSAADLWSAKAVAGAGTAEASYNPQLRITPEGVGPNAFYHTAAGVHCVAALIAHARWDIAAMRAALAAFVAAARVPAEHWDLTLGRSSLLVGCALLTETIPSDPLIDCGALLDLGAALTGEIWSHFEALPPIGACAEFPSLGIAHGWAGVLFAQLRWTEARGAVPPPGLERRLDELAACVQGDAAPRPNSAASKIPGWCNGPAGVISLWTLAHAVYHDPRYLMLAAQSAAAVLSAETNNGSLCCGLTGMSYGLLSLYRAGGGAEWLTHARALAARALSARFPESHPHSLYKGPLGARLLELELQQPDVSCLPLFESEGWPPG